MDTASWITFFLEAGIPQSIAAKYAILFNEHRIKQDMLLDLSKEYLNDMGIKTMGDVIAILKYARITHDQIANDKIIGEMKPSPSQKRVATRILDHYTKNLQTNAVTTSPNTQKLTASVRKQAVTQRIIDLKKRVSIKPATIPHQTKKVRQVSPQEEGGYKIIMPRGTTAKTRKILQKQKLINAALPTARKDSIFNRLGEGIVSSTSDSPMSPKSQNIFARLGQNTIEEPFLQLPYKGVLKTPPAKLISLNRAKTFSGSGVHSRLGPAIKESATATSSILKKSLSDLRAAKNSKIIKTKTTLNVKQRLGIASRKQAIINPKSTALAKTSVFERLGRVE